jgi:hypothetical protein
MQEPVGEKIATWIFGTIGLGLAVFFVWPVFERMQNEITVYSMFCTTARVNGVCKGDEQTANPSSFKVYPDQQSVVTWIGNGPVTRYEHCAVRDVSNWRCQNGSFEHTMTDGEYTEVAEPPFLPITKLFYQAPRWRWWTAKLSELGGKR